MKVTRCDRIKGHFYDADRFSTCPHCAKLDQEAQNGADEESATSVVTSERTAGAISMHNALNGKKKKKDTSESPTMSLRKRLQKNKSQEKDNLEEEVIVEAKEAVSEKEEVEKQKWDQRTLPANQPEKPASEEEENKWEMKTQGMSSARNARRKKESQDDKWEQKTVSVKRGMKRVPVEQEIQEETEAAETPVPEITAEEPSVEKAAVTETAVSVEKKQQPVQADDHKWEQKTVAVKKGRRTSSLQEAVTQAGTSARYSRTQTLAEFHGESVEKEEEPAVGWLSFVKGEYIGTSFSLKKGENTIGRSLNMDVALTQELTVSRNRHTAITYETRTRKFILEPSGEGKNPIYLNGEEVTEPCILSSYDRIQIGDSRCVFIALCGERFDWEDYM